MKKKTGKQSSEKGKGTGAGRKRPGLVKRKPEGRTYDPPLAINGTLDDVLRAAVSEDEPSKDDER